MAGAHVSTLIVVGYPLIRHGIALALGGLCYTFQRSEAHDARQARRLCEETQPDLIIVDMELDDGGGLGLLREFPTLRPDVKMLALSEREDATWVQRVLRAGAAGYVSKHDGVDDLQCAISSVLGNTEKFVGPRMSRHLMKQFFQGETQADLQAVERLSDREIEVFRLLGAGRGSRAAARDLGMSPKTIETHHARIKVKLGVRTGEELKLRARAWLLAGQKSHRPG